MRTGHRRSSIIERLETPPAPQVDPFQGRSFRLDLVNAAEDIPRLLRAYIKVGKLECALVIRPGDRQAMLIHSEHGQTWKWSSDRSDVPQRPKEPVGMLESIQQLKTAQTNLPRQGPVTLRGMWSGKLSCENGQPRITLTRKVASYGTLTLVSNAQAGTWQWTVERKASWFSASGQQVGTASSLLEAIQQGLANAMGLLGEACSVRDSHRRAALDQGYGALHPIKLAREGKDPLERLKPKEPPARRGRPAKTPTTQTGDAADNAGKQVTAQAEMKAKRTRKTAPVASAATAPAKPVASTAGTTAAGSSALPPTPQATAASSSEEVVDQEKDKALMAAFSAALNQVLGGVGL